MKFRVEHHKTFIEEASSEELAFLKKALKVYVPIFNAAPNAPPFELINLYYKEDKSFPTGFLEQLKKKLNKEALVAEIKDSRTYSKGSCKFKLDRRDRFEALDHQKEALPLIYKDPVGVVSAATGSGKSYLIEETIDYYKSKTLIIVPTQSIQNQLYQAFIKIFGKHHVSVKAPKIDQDEPEETEEIPDSVITGEDAYDLLWDKKPKNPPPKKNVLGSDYQVDEGNVYKKKKVLGSDYLEEFYPEQFDPEEKYQKKKGLTSKLKSNWGKGSFKKANAWQNQGFKAKPKKKHPGADITILCFQSLPETSRDFLKTIECVIIDECHHASAETIRDALDLMEKAAYRYGFSATPWRDKNHDHKLLMSALGEKIIYDLSGKEAVDRGIIAKPIYKILVAPKPDEYLRDYRNWRVLVDKGIVGNATRNKMIVDNAIELMDNDHNVFICVDEIAHLEILKERFKEKKIEVLIVHGQQNEKINNKNVKTIGDTSGPMISIGTMAVGEGTNMPNITAVILAGYGKASNRFLQRIGRGTRKLKTKNEVVVIDIEDWFNPTLMKHSKARQKTFKKYFDPED